MTDIDRYATTNIMAQSRIEELERRLAHAQACLAEVDAQLNIVGASPSDYATHLELLKEGRDNLDTFADGLTQQVNNRERDFAKSANAGMQRTLDEAARQIVNLRFEENERALERDNALNERDDALEQLCALAFDYGRLEAERDDAYKALAWTDDYF